MSEGDIFGGAETRICTLSLLTTPRYLNFETFAGLSHDFPYSKSNVSLQNVVTVFGYPNKIIFNLVASVASLTAFHAKYYKPVASEMLPA